MRKLNQKKVRWIVREMEKGERSVYRIAKIQNVTPRWVRELYRIYRETGRYPYPKKPGRAPTPIMDEDKRIVLEVRRRHPVCAVTLERILNKTRNIHIPHNRIHRILKEEGLVKDEPKKQRRRKWIRYERKHSNSLWHTDWFEEGNDQIILFEDDASRFVTGIGIFTSATSKNAKIVFRGLQKSISSQSR